MTAKELLIVLDDGDGCPQSFEQREPAVESEGSARPDPEQAATQVFKVLQRESLARETSGS